MKKILLVLCLGITLTGCADHPDGSAQNRIEEIQKIPPPIATYRKSAVDIPVICSNGYLFYLYHYSQLNSISFNIDYRPVVESNQLIKCKDE